MRTVTSWEPCLKLSVRRKFRARGADRGLKSLKEDGALHHQLVMARRRDAGNHLGAEETIQVVEEQGPRNPLESQGWAGPRLQCPMLLIQTALDGYLTVIPCGVGKILHAEICACIRGIDDMRFV